MKISLFYLIITFYIPLSFATKTLFNIYPLTQSNQTVFDGSTVITRFLIQNNSRDNFINIKSFQNVQVINESGQSCHFPKYLKIGETCVLSLKITNITSSNPIADGPIICLSDANGCINPYFCSKPSSAWGVQLVASPLYVSVGINDSTQTPLILQSQNSGLTWSAANISDDIPGGQFVFSNCYQNNFCLAVGGTPAHETATITPFIYTSAPNGANWTKASIAGIPPYGNLYSASCNDDLSTCISAGYNYLSSSLLNPLLSQTTNGGNSWAVQPISGITSNFNGSFIKSTCIGSGNSTWCIASGQTATNGDLASRDNTPLLAQTTNNGNTWSMVTPTNVPSKGYLYTTSCGYINSSAYCVSVGQNYINNSFLIVDSLDGGNTWTTNPSVASFGPGELNDVHCIENQCFAIGALHGDGLPPSTIYTPTIIKTVNAGITWTQVNVANQPPNGNYYSISCSKGAIPACIAVGVNYENDNPLIAQSNNGGQTWSIADLTQITKAKLNGGSCNGSGTQSICVATGQNLSLKPVILRTPNGGENWYDLSSSINNLGAFYANSASY